MRIVLLYTCCLLHCLVQAQSNWQSIPHDFYINSIKQIYHDPLEDALWLVGDIRDPNDFTNYLVLKYDGLNWEYYDGFNQITEAIVRYGDELYIAGQFGSIDDQPINGLARFVGDGFENGGIDYLGQIHTFEIIEGELFVGGSFSSFNGIEVDTELVKYDGFEWLPYEGLPETAPAGNITAIQQFDESFWVGGNFTMDVFPGLHDIIYEHDGEWHAPENGIIGGFSGVWDFEVFQEKLYVGGMIDATVGNPSNGIMRWNGNAWESIGLGVTGPFQQPGINYVVRNFLIVEDKLFLSGGFIYAGDVGAQSIAYFDGERYCALGGDFGLSPISNMVYYHDELYVSCGDFIDGIEVDNFAKYIGDMDDVLCSSPVSITKYEPLPYRLYPNPAAAILNWECPEELDKLVILNSFGQFVLIKNIKSVTSTSIAHLKSGMYIVQLSSDNAVFRQKLIVE